MYEPNDPARVRIRWLAATLAGIELGFAPLRYALRDSVEAGVPWLNEGVGVANVLAALLLVALARSRRISPSRVLELALVWAVLVAFRMELTTNSAPLPEDPLRAVSWTSLWMVVFPLVIGASPRKTLPAVLLAAAMTPLSLLYWYPDTTWTVAVAWMAGPSIGGAFVLVPLTVLRRQTVAVERLKRAGTYKLIRRLGRGGLGEVWLGRHQLLARPAAVKLMRLQEAPLDRRDRRVQDFLEEADITCSLVSPHTVRLFDFGETDDGRLYYVMELLDGMDLRTLVRDYGPVPISRAVHLLRQACRSLAEAHQRGLIHRDIKPANLMVCRYGLELDFVKVLDFGLASHVQALPQQPGGTPGYTPPERLTREHPEDERSDVYTLGAVFFWLVTGTGVFSGRGAMGALAAHMNERPRVPSAVARRPIPPEVDELILQCLEKDPARRPANMIELEQRLSEIEVRDEWTAERRERWWSAIPRPPMGGGTRRKGLAPTLLPSLEREHTPTGGTRGPN